MLDKKFMQGVIDLHIHAGPSVAKRKVDGYDMLLRALDAGYAGFLVKDHYVSSADGCRILDEHFGDKCHVFGSIAMNKSIGGFNVMAIDVAYNMGAKIVYMPTVSSKLHLDAHKGKSFHGSGGVVTPEEPVYYIDDNGNLDPKLLAVLDYIGEHSDMVLATGHGSPEEIDALIPEAFKRGVRKILVNHPNYMIGASMEQILNWAKQGAFIEVTAMEHGMVLEDRDDLFNPIDLIKKIIDMGVPETQIIIDSDFGQNISPYPDDGLYKYLNLIHDMVGITEDQLTLMVKDNPAYLMGLKER